MSDYEPMKDAFTTSEMSSVIDWAMQNAELDPSNGGTETDFDHGYRAAAAHVRYLLTGEIPIPWTYPRP